MNTNENFIITTNNVSADLLLKTGFKLVSQFGNQWTFLNNEKMLFDNLEDIIYTNKLCI